MASGKLSPRQKMINMMYLVLTALLALNVSKEILDSFVVVNNGLETTKLTLKQKMEETYTTFSDYAKQNPEKYGAANGSAQQLEKEASSLMLYIDSLKVKLISETEGKPAEKLIGKNANGQDTIMNLHLVEAKDDYNHMTHIMVGSEPAKPKEGPYTAVELKSKLVAFANTIKQIVGTKNPVLTGNVDRIFTFSDQQEAGDNGPMTKWETVTFYHVPLAAGVCILSKFQMDVRNAENETVNWLLGNVEKKTFKFSTLTPMVDPLTSYVTVGSTYKADIFLGAFDPQNKPIVEISKNGTVDTVKNEVIGDKDILPIGPDGKAKLEIPASGAGERTYKGVVIFRPVGSPEQRFSFSEKFEVAAPNLVVSPTKMNVFYRGIENPVEISVAGYSAKDIVPGMTNGSLTKATQGYIVKPGNDVKAMVSVTVTNPDGTKKSMPGVEFRVKNVPSPQPYFGGKTITDQTIKKGDLTIAAGVIAKLEAFEFDLKFTVVEYTVSATLSGTAAEERVMGAAISDRAKQILGKVKTGQKVYIENVKVRAPDGTVRTIGNLAFKVI